MPTGLEKQMAKRATDCGDTPLYDSKVVAPRNPKLIRGDPETEKLTPSSFMREMAQSTHEKLANTHDMRIPQVIELLDMGDTTYQMVSEVDIDEPMFQPFPSEITFLNYEPFEVYEVPLVLRNNDKVPRLVKVVQADSPYFKVISPHDVSHKVAPGIPTIFKVQFIPEEKKDYMHELVCITEREKFIVPVKAIGARAMLDFPDDVTFPTSPVKYPSTKMLLVRNIGNREAKFSLNTERPFSVNPEKGILPVGESMQIELTFKPLKVGDHSRNLIINYETNEKVYINLYGCASDANVRLDKSSVRIENTFISMANQRAVTISNRSNVIVHYQWKPFATLEEEIQQKERFCQDLESEEAMDHDKFLAECITDPTVRDKMAILTQTFSNRRKLIETDNMLFSDDVFVIEPSEGDIWPNSSAEVNVIFKPQETAVYSRTAYCDITGRESRLPLRIRGDGIGPKLIFSFDSLDMGHIFIGSTHTYEVVLSNTGDIEASFQQLPSQTTFGPCFKFEPSEGLIRPGGHQAVLLSFCSVLLGDFDEVFEFSVDGSPSQLQLQFKGCVIGPTFHFDVPRLKFGTVSYGFVNIQCATLVNTALVPMNFVLRVPGDGTDDTVCATSGEVTLGKTGHSKLPKEFTITPDHGTIDPQSELKIQVQLISNTLKKYDMAMVVDVEGVGSEILSLPIIAKCVVPPVVIVSPILDYTRCFLDYPYEQSVQLFNDSDLPAKYDLVPQVIGDLSTILYTSPEPTGIIQPHSVIDIPLVITPQGLEELEVVAEFSIFGSSELPLQVQLICIGEGPVVHVTPHEIDWGQTQVLTDVTRTVKLSNESLIPAEFTCSLVRPNSLWKAEPASGVIPPEEALEIQVTVNLDDCIKFHDKLAISFVNSQVHVVKLHAVGFGTTIVSDPPMTPSIHLGHHFSNRSCKRMFTLTNKGRRHQQMFWSTEGFPHIKTKNNKDAFYNPKDMKYQRMPPPPAPPRPVFTLTPSRFELDPGQSIEVVLDGQSDQTKLVKERLVCHAIIGKSSGKEKIMKTDISINFISPLLEFSSKQVCFRVDKHPDDVLEMQAGELEFSNVSSLPLTTLLSLEYPFQLVNDNGEEVASMEIPVGVGEIYKLTLQFDPAYEEDSVSRVAEKVLTISYLEHPHVDYISLRGEVFFPNLTFEKMTVDFGCILNDTEVTRYVNITNDSPMPVRYRWSFLEPEQPIVLYPQPIPQEQIEEVMMDDNPSLDQPPIITEDLLNDDAENVTEKEEHYNTEDLLTQTDNTENEQKDLILPPGEKEDKVLEKKEEKKDHEKKEKDNEQHEKKKGSRKSPRKTTSKSGSKSGKSSKLTGDKKDEEKDVVISSVVEPSQEAVETLTDEKTLPERMQSSRLSIRPASVARKRKAKLAYIQTITEPTVVGIEEVFDILPLYGCLMPGDSDTVTFTFYGHTDIGSEAKALCDVEGGPQYELNLKGEASLVCYSFDSKEIDFGKRMFDQVNEADIVLRNTGKVGFDFNAINMDPAFIKRPAPGVPVMIPNSGHIEAHSEQRLTIKFLPGIPVKFHKSFEIQVAHFEPDCINLYGEGVFPRVSFDLPRYGDTEGKYDELLKEAKENLGRDVKKCDKNERATTPQQTVTTRDPAQEDAKSICSMQLQSEFPSELELQIEVERLMVKEFSLDQQQNIQNREPVPPASTQEARNGPTPRTGQTTSLTNRSKRAKKPKARLPDYILDFGYVVLGTVRTHIVRATNTGHFPVSFAVDRSTLNLTGFNVELDRVKQLPGAPDHETVDFRVSFDPRGGNVDLGAVEALVPIMIVNGPSVFLRLKANVTMPDMQISTDSMDFGEVQCGQCKVITVQLHNNQHVRCEWSSLPSDKDKKKIDKHVPMHLRRKMKPEKPKPRNFEMMPSTGMLFPGQRLNVQVKFMPTEEKIYAERMVIRLARSSQRITLMANGVGLEPRLEFGQTLIEFGPILPHSQGDEVDVTVKNPCGFPIEFYSLEFDKQYLEEEKVLRLMKGYDEYNTILLPPRDAGDKLPQELLEYFEEQKKKVEEEEQKEKEEAEAAAAAAAEAAAKQEGEEASATAGEKRLSFDDVALGQGSIMVGSGPHLATDQENKAAVKEGELTDGEKLMELKEQIPQAENKKDDVSSLGVGELQEITPVSAAIARHLGIDLSPDGKAAMRRRGVAIVVHGAPLSGKTSTAITLAKYYEAALLTIDGVVLEAISNCNSIPGQKARELCSQAAKAQLIKEGEGNDAQGMTAAGGLSVEAVTAHAMGTGSGSVSVGGAHSVISNRKTSTISGHKPAHSTQLDEKPGRRDKKQEVDNATQISSSPTPPAPIARRLSVSASVAGEEGLMSCVLPDELLVEILAERLQLNDCHRGIVFDGLETLFSPNQPATAGALLKAFNNRKYIYFITLKLEHAVLQAREKKEKEEKELLEKQQEEEEKQRLEEMSEEEYDALDEEEKAAIDLKRLKAKKERLLKKEMEERLERERKEKELAALIELQKLEDEKNKKKKGLKQQEKDGGKAIAGKKIADSKMSTTGSVVGMKVKADGKHDPSITSSDHAIKMTQSIAMERPESHGTAGSETQGEETGKKRRKDKRPISNEIVPEPEVEKDPVKEAELLLANRFKAFEHSFKDIDKLLDRWDRTIGQICLDPNADDADADETPVHPPSGRKGRGKIDKEKEKERERERLEKERLEKEKAEKEKAAEDGDEEGEENNKDEVGVCHILLDVSDETHEQIGDRILQQSKLPAMAEVMDGLGLGPNGPPIPPSASFSVVPYPVKRRPPMGGDANGHYVFVASSPDDPNVSIEDKPKELEPDIELGTPERSFKDRDDHPSSLGKTKGKDKVRAGAESSSSRRRSAKSRNRKGSLTVTSPPPGSTTPGSDADGQSSTGDLSAIHEPKNPRLSTFRWMIQPGGEVTLRLRFQSEELGQFDQTLNFEITGTRRRYQLFNRGICSFPNISREPRIVFPNRKKSKRTDEIVHKKYILSTETLMMGPLLAGKSRDRYKEGKYPENTENLKICNTSPLDVEVSFCFQYDSNATTFLLDPPSMSLKPGETQELSIWVYPKNQGYFEDSIVCCIRENPEPVMFKVACYGVRPELELDKKQLHFERVLLHRKDNKTIYLRNSTLLPVSWRISGLENLGDDFSVTTDSGVIEPKSEFALNANFRAMKPITLKKTIRLEVSDAENIMGLLQTENIQVIAEAYDVALDMSFPKGADGGLDFGVIKVMDETKQTCSLKNKGRYDIAFNFVLEPTSTCGPEQLSLFSVIPQKGVLLPNDRPTSVQVIFKSRKEITIKDQQILKCHVIEPSVTEGGETIASIPVKLSVRSIFSKYNIFPVNDINFGAVLTNTRKQRSFTIENKGEFDFKYFITKMQKNVSSQQPVIRGRVPPGGKRSKSRDDSSSGRSVIRPKRADSMRQDMGGGNPSRLQLGMFTVYPAYGMVAPGNQVVVQVDCLAESEGKGDEDVAIDIHDRDPAQSPQGIPYKLLAEACSPGINVVDITSVFEEHRICKNLSVFLNNHQLDMESGGVYGEDENRFLFGNVLVGRRSKARFKIMNRNKISCDVVFNCKLNSSKVSSKLQDIFEVEPNRACIPAHSHVYAEVTFSPPSMQTYTGSFEVVVDGLSGSQAKQKNLGFEVQGEGNLPRITVSKPSIRNKKGSPVLLFSQILIDRTQSLPFSLKNEGTLPSKVDIDLNSSDGAFILKAHSDTKLIHPMESDYNPEFDEEVPVKRPHTASVIIGVDECANFDVIFKPSEPARCTGTIRVSVMDNQYEDTIVQLVGEGYQDEITLDNIHSFIDDNDIENLVGAEEVMAAPSNLIHFRDCHIGEPRQLTFTMTNHSTADTVRFQWPDHPQLKFLPMVGHLHAGCAKDISITFKTDEPVTLQNEAINAKISKITFDKPVDQVADWDDRLRTVKWVDITLVPTRPNTNDAANRPKSTQDIKKEEKEKEGKHKRGAAAAAAAAAAAQEQLEKERCEEEMMKKTKEMMETPRPSKKKVIETEPEPAHVIMDDSNRDIELRVSVNADFAKFKCKPDVINFKDTLMFQTRVYTFFIANKGSIQLDYSWQVVMEELAQRKSVSFADEEQLRLPSRCSTSIMSDVPDIFPFTIMPDVGTIPAGKKQNFNIMFSPLDVQDHEGRLICRIPNLEPGKQGPVIAVQGKSIMPYCHFELEDSDYITSARRNPELRGPGGAPPGATLDPNTRVIEFNSTGVNVKNPRNFYIVNPTSQGYSFLWTCEDEPDPKEPDVFHCLIPNGYVNPGKKFEILFDFIPNKLDIVESFWRFTIPEQNISVPFLLVGNAREPAISMDRSHINFRSILLGNAAEETVYLANNEEKPFQFSIDETSCHSEGFSSFVTVTPMDGIIPPHGKLPINVHFVPREQKEVNFNLQVSIRKKTLPIQLNVKAEGYSMCATLLCEDSQGKKVELTSKGLNEINFGEIEVNEKAVRSFFIINTGKFNFDFEWILTSRKKSARYLLINPESGSVVCNDRKRCVLAFKPTSTMVLSGIELLLKVANGPTFPINVVGSGVAPSLHFSFVRHDFGPCFIHRAGMPTHTALLTITNKDNKDISLDCHYASTSFLEVHFSAQVLQPNQCCDVHLTFYPREATKYHETIAFEVNGLSRQNIEIHGQGTEMRVEVANPKDKNLNLGALRIGQTVKKTVPIVNKSPAPITFNVVITPFSQVLQQLPNVLNLSPSHSITLKPKGGTYNLDMLFTPKCRIPQFTEEVMLECEGLSQPLFVVNGSCQGIEITLDRDSIPFGAVSLRSSTKRKLLMYNTGDIGAAFKWNLEHFAPDFNISPVAGYISPGMTVSFEITFHPQELCQDVRYDKLRCTIEGSKPLKLVLTGMCVGCVPMKETLHFNTHVRVKETRSVNLHNRSNLRWNLKPVIEGEHWSGAESIIVDPQSSKPYEVTYRPLIMTHEGKKHTGAVFFALPDGNGLLYNLTGVSEPPKAAGNIQREVPSKTHYTELLSVSNWLKRPQRFKVYVEMIKPDKLDPATTLKGLDYIDVPGLAKRDYKLNFYCHKESSYAAKVVFKNDQTHEFQFYYITLKSLAPDIISTIEMITPVRLTTSKTIVMENPLAVSVTFQTNCQASDIMLPTQLVIPPQSEGSLVFEYLPLKVGTTQGKLTLTSAELGLYQYNLALTATAAGPEKAVYFRAPLGGNHVQVARFINYAKVKAEYTCKIDSSEFHCDKTVTAAPGSAGGGTEVNLDVTFEPSRLGETRATLTVSSPLAGEYTFPLFGTCIAPKPQGPYTIKANSTASIPFRNVFPHSTAFTFQVDNPSFSCKAGDTIRGKKTHNIIVGFEGNQDGTKAPKMGKLVVTCPRSAGGASSVAWTYYVRGVTP